MRVGWEQSMGIVKEAVSTLQERYAIDPQSITAGIGPAIGPDHYQVGPDVEHRVIERFGEQSEYLLAKVGEKCFSIFGKPMNSFFAMRAFLRLNVRKFVLPVIPRTGTATGRKGEKLAALRRSHFSNDGPSRFG